MKSYLGYRLEKLADGSYTFTPPDDYLDLEPPDPLTGPTVFFNPWTGEPSDPGGGSPRRCEQPALAGVSGPGP